MPIALDDLGGKFRRLEPELFTNMTLDPRIEMRMRADRAAQLADGNPLQRLGEALLGAAKFIEHERELETERDRLRVNAVAAPDHRRHFVAPGLLGHDAAQFAQIVEQDFARGDELNRECSVEDVRRGQPLMNPARRGPDRGRDIFREMR